jgi:hypothetical protein
MSSLCGVIGGLFEAGCNEMFVLGYSLGQLPVLEHRRDFPQFSTFARRRPPSPEVPATVIFCTGVHLTPSFRPSLVPVPVSGRNDRLTTETHPGPLLHTTDYMV